MSPVTNQDLKRAEESIERMLGWKKYQCGGRYGYIGIDVYDKQGGCLRTYEAGLTKRQALDRLHAIMEGIEAVQLDR